VPRSNSPEDIFHLFDMRGTDDCWPYIGSSWGGRERDKRPYFMSNGRRQMAYRWVYELVHGVILTPDQSILHSCDNGGYPVGCGNPAHIRIGTVQENSNDMKARERHGMPKTVVKAIRRLIEEGRPQHEIADLYGVSREAISAIATGRVYGHVE
jgi:hypothetical protein